MVQISGTNERFLAKPVVLSEVLRIMEPDLAFMDKIPNVDSGGEVPIYLSKTTKAADAKKQKPKLTSPSSRFPEVEITRATKKSALLSEEGLSIRFDKSAIQKKSGVDIIADSLQTVGYWLAEYMNSNIYSTLDEGSTDAGASITALWSAADATPIDDCRQIKNAMRREGYPYRMTDMYVHQNDFNDMEGYLIGHEVPQFREAALNCSQSQITLPLEGKPVLTGLYSGVTEGDILGLDRNKPAAAMYYYNDPQFSQASVSYETIVNGMPTMKTVPNFGLNMHKYFEDDTHDTVIQLWFDTGVVVKDPYGIITEDGI